MAISRSSFMGERGGSSGVAGMKGMRRISPKDTANLLKSVNAINKNLISINKLLQTQSKTQATAERTKQTQKIKQAENIRKQATEARLESGGIRKAGDAIKNALVEPAKGVMKGLMGFVKPFLKFFAVTFIGWFSKGIMAWFKQEKEVKKKQIKEAIPKVLSFLTIAGGVMAALNFGLPVIIGLLGTLLSTIPLAIGVLFNPIVLKGILIAGGIAAGSFALMEAAGFVSEIADPGQRVRERISRALGAKSNVYDLDAKTKTLTTGGMNSNITGGGVPTTYIDIGNGEFIKSNDLSKYLQKQDDLPYELRKYTIENDRARAGDKITVESATLRKQLAGMASTDVDKLVDQKSRQALSSQYKALAVAKNNIKQTKSSIATLEGSIARAKEAGDAEDVERNKAQLANRQADLARFENDRAFALSKVTANYSRLSSSTKEELRTQLGITAEDLFPDSLTASEGAYQSGRATRAAGNLFRGMISPISDTLGAKMDIVDEKIAGFIDMISESVSSVNVNLSINPTIDNTADDTPDELPDDGVGLSPFDMSNPFIHYSNKVYLLAGVV